MKWAKYLKRNITIFIIILSTACTCFASGTLMSPEGRHPSNPEEPVYFADANLKAAVEEALSVTDPTPMDMLGLTYLEAYAREIHDLTGIEYAANLQRLDLYENQVSDLLPLSSLTSLQQLWIGENPISDISPLSELINLQLLWLSSIQINDISPLSTLTNLQKLYLDYNRISDISPLSELTNLQDLSLVDNHISNISPLSGLTNLQRLLLNGNQISNLLPISNLTSLQELWLSQNNISDISPLTGLANLQRLLLTRNRISDISCLYGLTNLECLCLSENQLNDISSLSQLTELQELLLDNNWISDITPISGLMNLKYLDLGYNQYSDISPVSDLTNLTYLDLGYNQIEDISLLSGLTKLEQLKLRHNQISDILPLSQLRCLKELLLSHNQISDISPLFELIEIRNLYLNSNRISDISTLSRLVNLEYLNLNDNQVSDISPLSGITGIQRLWLQINPLGIDAHNIDIPLLESYGTIVYYDPLVWHTLTITSTDGGSVTEPGEGDFDYISRTIVDVNAAADPNYYFVEWTGTAVDTGMVTDPESPVITITMNANYTLQANFDEYKVHFIYVDDDATGANDGSSWENGYNFLQDALAKAENIKTPVEIRIAQGIYKPDQGQDQTLGDRNATFRLSKGITIKGGYAGVYQPDPNVRDIELYKTILSGDLNGDDAELPDAQSLLGHRTRVDNSYNVCIGFSSESTAVIDGLYITGGNANNQEAALFGGGILCFYTPLEILNCTFQYNTANYYGGAIYNHNSEKLLITNCKFFRNASDYGGAILYPENTIITDCRFTENYASREGGAINAGYGAHVITNCIFEYNSSTYGGAVNYACDPSITNCTLTLINCNFTGNYAERFGGGFYNLGIGRPDPNSLQLFDHCTFKDNHAGIYGGGIYNGTSSRPSIKNCLFVNNSSSDWGGALHFWNSNAEIINCTITNNYARRGGAIACGYANVSTSSNVKINNCILWNNSQEIYNYDDSHIITTHSCMPGLIPGRNGFPMGMVSQDPMFVNPGYWDPNGTPEDPNDDFWVDGDYHLKSQAGRSDPAKGTWVFDDATSPCIDAGDPNSPIGDEPQPNGGIINMGAYGGTNEASKSYVVE